MIATSEKWKEYRQTGDIFHIRATMYGSDSTSIELTDKDFMMGSVSFTDAMSGLYEIDFGAVDTNSFYATLNNFDGKFDDWKWETIFVQFGIENLDESAIVGLAVPGISIVGTDEDDVGEWIPRGFYHIDRPKTTGNTIKIECYDTMDKLNKAFAGLNETITYPVQSNSLITSICSYCGINYIDNDFSNFTIDEFEVSDTTSCRQVLYWVLETLGGYGRMTEQNNRAVLNCKKWTIGEWGSSDDMNGGSYSALTPWNDYRNQSNIFNKNTRTGDKWISIFDGQPAIHSGGFCSDFISVTKYEFYYMSVDPVDGYVYQYDSSKNYIGSALRVVGNKFGVLPNVAYIRFNGNTADVDSYGVYAPRSWFYGGFFNPWDQADIVDVDGGMYYEGQQPYEIDNITSRSIALDDVEITGVRAFSQDGTVNDLDGTDGYIVTIRDNPLVDENNTDTVATRAWGSVQGLKVRPFEVTMFGDPSMEAGDVVLVDDTRGNYHTSVITSLEYTLNGSTRVGCYALTAEENFNANQ